MFKRKTKTAPPVPQTSSSRALPQILLGTNPNGTIRWQTFEKNLLTVAGAGSGKGAAQIILNLMYGWQNNAVVIDPSGEAAEATCHLRTQEHTEKEWTYEREVAVIDPYGYADVNDRFRARFNPLDLVDGVADLRNLAAGLITRSDTDKGHFVNSAEDVAAGLLGFILLDPSLDDDERHIGTLRIYISLLQDDDTKTGTVAAMKACEGFGGLVQDVAKRLSPDNTEVQNILGTLRTQTRWLNSEEVVHALSASRFDPPQGVSGTSAMGAGFDFSKGRKFDLRKIKTGQMDVFLVVPGDKLESDAIFLRLFVRACISIMMRKGSNGQNLDSRCLFILDEAFAIGHLSELESASGQMRKYGLHLWPFFQSVAQITKLYGKDGLEILSEDANIFTVFGAQGKDILAYASDRLGNLTADDLAVELDEVAGQINEDRRFQGRPDVLERAAPKDGKIIDDEYLRMRKEMLQRKIGSPRYTPDELRTLLAKQDNEPLPRVMLTMLSSGDEFLKPLGWFNMSQALDEAEKVPRQRTKQRKTRRPIPSIYIVAPIVGGILLVPELRNGAFSIIGGLIGGLFETVPLPIAIFVFFFGAMYVIRLVWNQPTGIRAGDGSTLSQRTQWVYGRYIKWVLTAGILWVGLEWIGLVPPYFFTWLIR